MRDCEEKRFSVHHIYVFFIFRQVAGQGNAVGERVELDPGFGEGDPGISHALPVPFRGIEIAVIKGAVRLDLLHGLVQTKIAVQPSVELVENQVSLAHALLGDSEDQFVPPVPRQVHQGISGDLKAGGHVAGFLLLLQQIVEGGPFFIVHAVELPVLQDI